MNKFIPLNRVAIILAVLCLIGLNFFLIARRQNPSAQKKAKAIQAATAKFTQHQLEADELIDRWNSGSLTRIDSPNLATAVKSIPNGNCLPLPVGGVPWIEPLPDACSADLQAAIVGLLKAYEADDSQIFVDYMHDRGQHFSKSKREAYEKVLRRKGNQRSAELTDEQVFVEFWNLGRTQAWRAIAVDSSCVQIWNGKAASLKTLSQFANGNEDDKDSAAGLLARMRHAIVFRSTFVSDAGSIQEEHEMAVNLILADVRLIVEYEKESKSMRVPYLVRLWFNRTLNRWQPCCLAGFFPKGKRRLNEHIPF